ncbi:MAG: FAD:protein FMN transferase, partial [Chlamydiia bacterium]|nr:FAD:protein FMN transferase [Chlamydiia bacterium]
DLLVEGLTEMGYANIFVEWGGELRAYGHHPSGRPWMVAIRDAVSVDGENAKSLIQFPLEDSAIATSGNYLQQWRCEGRCYTHIINPLTGIPLEVTDQTPTSVTVLAQSCAEADAYATACMLFPSRNAATEWANAVTLRNPTLVFWIY